MPRYRVSFEIETESDPSHLLDTIQEIAPDHFEGEIDGNKAMVEDLS